MTVNPQYLVIKLALSDDSIEPVDPDDPNSKIYCTVPNDNGSYDIVLTDANGATVTVFDRICIQYQEYFGENQFGGKIRILSSRMNIKQKSTTVRNSAASSFDVEFFTEFFVDADPDVRLAFFSCGKIERECNATVYAARSATPFGNEPEILPRAHHEGLLHIRYYNRELCP